MTTATTPITEIHSILKDLKNVVILPDAQVHFRTEKYIGAPEPGVEEYERVLYRYSLVANPQAISYQDAAFHIQTVPVENRSARFGRDAEFETMDFIQEVLNSDVNTSWMNMVCKCPDCKRWLLSDKPTEIDVKGVSCFSCMDEKVKPLDDRIRKATLEEKAAIHKKFAAEISESTGLTLDTVLEYIVTKPEVAKSNLSVIKPVQIDRFTIELGNEDIVWPDWWEKSPEEFRAFALQCKADPNTLYVGQLEQAAFKKAREEWHEKQGEKFLPNSPRIGGLLTAFKATPEVLREFELRGGKGLVKASEAVSKGDKIYLSNDADPLLCIGAWGGKHYSSCQNWRVGNLGGHCKTHMNLEDPNVMVLWYGTRNTMKERVLIRLLAMKKDGERAIGFDRWYGNGANRKEMIKAMKEWAKTQGITKVGHITGGERGGADASKNAESVTPVKFSKNNPSYTDLGAWYQTKTGGEWTYKVYFTDI